MNLEEFLNRFGTDTTSNFQLIKWSKELGIKPFYYVMRNEIKKLKKIKISRRSAKRSPVYIIANYQTTSESGSHHVALYRGAHTSGRDSERSSSALRTVGVSRIAPSFYMDTFGIQPLLEVIDFLEDGVYSTFKIQPVGSKMCSQLSLYILYRLSQGFDFYDTVLEMNNYFNIENG